MKTKIDYQKEIGDLEQQIGDITKRRANLCTDRDKIIASTGECARIIGEAILEGHDTLKEFDSLARDKAKLDGLNEAINQADRRIKDMKFQLEENKKYSVGVDFNRIADETNAYFVECVDQFFGAYAALIAIEAKIGELEQIGGAAGISVDGHDHLRAVRNLSHNLREGFEVKIKLLKDQDSVKVIDEARAKGRK
jgi:hypothetical protein